MFAVTLIEGTNDMRFVFGSFEQAVNFVKSSLTQHIGHDTDCGKENLVVEIEVIGEKF